MQTDYHNQAKTRLVAVLVSLVVIAGMVSFADHLKEEHVESLRAAAQTASNTYTNTTMQSMHQSGMSSNYKDGTYAATSNYYVPSGYQTIRVRLTVKNGVVTNSSIKNSESDPTSASFQQDFASVYKSYVVGRNISDIQLSYVAGASDTSQGFDDALSQIVNQAKA